MISVQKVPSTQCQGRWHKLWMQFFPLKGPELLDLDETTKKNHQMLALKKLVGVLLQASRMVREFRIFCSGSDRH